MGFSIRIFPRLCAFTLLLLSRSPQDLPLFHPGFSLPRQTLNQGRGMSKGFRASHESYGFTVAFFFPQRYLSYLAPLLAHRYHFICSKDKFRKEYYSKASLAECHRRKRNKITAHSGVCVCVGVLHIPEVYTCFCREAFTHEHSN